MAAPLRIGVVGAGSIARDQHLPAWQKLIEARLVAVADPSPVALAAVPADFQIERRVIDYREILDDPDIDVIDVCVPSGLHAEVAIAALSAGKHVLCEKPMATCRADAVAMLQAARRSGKHLMIAQQLRFEPAIIQARQFLQDHPLGTVYYARGQWLRRRRLPARPGFTERRLSGGGALYDLGVHVLDLAWLLMGTPRPLAASGQTFQHLARRVDLRGEWGTWDPATIDVEDFATGHVRLAGGALLSLEVSWLGFQPEAEFQRLQLYGTLGGFTWPDGVVSSEADGVAWDLRLAPTKGEPAHHAIVHAFAQSVLHDTPVPVSPVESAWVVAMLDALYASSATGSEAAVEPIDVEA